MSVEGPIDLSFMYAERLKSLVDNPQAKHTAPKGASTTAPSIFDAMDDDTLNPAVNTDPLALMTQATTAADSLSKRNEALLDFIIARAGYPENEAAAYRSRFERIILENGNIFESLFLEIKKHLADIELSEAAKGANDKKLSKNEIIVKAREQALATLGPAFFSKLGKYFSANNKYYFEENALAKELSDHFLTRIFQQPALARKMLDSQKQKTEGQAKFKKQQILNSLPSLYYSDSGFEAPYELAIAEKRDFTPADEDKYIHNLQYVADDFDLFFADPSIMTIATGQRKIGAISKAPRAEVLKRVHEVLASSSAMNALDKAFAQLNIDPHGIDIPEYKELVTYLERNGLNIALLDNLNPVEKIFVLKNMALTFINQKEEPRVKAMQGKLAEEIKTVTASIKAKREEITTQYLKDNHKGITLQALTEKLKQGMKDETVKINKKCAEDVKFVDLNKRLESLKAQSTQLDADFKALLSKVATLKQTFMSKYYPQVIPVAKMFAQHYQQFIEEKQNLDKFVQDGGTYSCLTFLPVKFVGNTPDQDRYECLVAMSGADIDDPKVIDAHQLLADFASTLKFKNFTFRYVPKNSGSLDLLLKQIGKGLSGTQQPLSSIKHGDALPLFEKACAEKRLVDELIRLFEMHGEKVQVLGCDNIALPKHADLKDERQKALKKVAKAAEDAKAAPASANAAQKAPKKVPTFLIDAKVEGAADKVLLEAEHITCCSSCQHQKPAVFTVAYDAMKTGSRKPAQTSVVASSEHAVSVIPVRKMK